MKKPTIIIVALLVFGMCHAQEISQFTVNHLALSVKDVNQSAQFYQNIFNLREIINAEKTKDVRCFSFGDGRELHLISSVKRTVKTNKAIHLALSTSHLETFIENLKQSNIQFYDWKGKKNRADRRKNGVQEIYLQDPDGYWIQVNSNEKWFSLISLDQPNWLAE
ncbi:VOC family protein [Yeosuana marina]|uniref:VOC family protein n=1 Tax=Yeosuana marina TaxID=1565536 RepID=UPI0014209049|nr:VOC family protein [Yeosuana marina]